MTIIIALLFLSLSFVTYFVVKDFFAPIFIVPCLWGLIMFFYAILDHKLNNLNGQFLIAISLWVFSFVALSIVTNLFFYPSKEYKNNITLFSPKIFTFYYYLLVFGGLASITLLIVEAVKSGPQYFFLRLRIINTGLEEDETFSLGVLAYVFNLSTVVVALFTLYKEKISNKRYTIVLIISFLLSIITLARTSIMILVFVILLIWKFKHKLKIKKLVKIGLILGLFLSLLTFFRSFHEEDVSGAEISTTYIYIFGAMPAFEMINDDNSGDALFGANTFRFFYAVSNTFGFNFKIEKAILPYVNMPVLTNVYSVLYPFYVDFGYIGVALFGSIYGFFYTFLYRQAKRSNPIFIILYSLIFYSLILQFMGEFIFSNFSSLLQFIILIMVPYFFSKIKL
ncbi:O-antigen polymerase [Flavobacterium sp.]|uniref:O-antigen polymerase n=1 Tax=Flavobacterium sp. TaxID=239 RepID=UPI00375174FD